MVLPGPYIISLPGLPLLQVVLLRLQAEDVLPELPRLALQSLLAQLRQLQGLYPDTEGYLLIFLLLLLSLDFFFLGVP